MAGNLVNTQDLDNYLKDVVYRGQEKEIFENGNFNSIAFVEQHKDAIVRSMLLKWTDFCLKPYMSTKTPQTMRFLPLINVMDDDLPAWAKRCMNEGKPVYRFQADKIPDSMKEKITTVRDYLYAVGEGYINKILARAKDTQKKYAKNPNAKGNKDQEKPKIRIDFLKTNAEYADFDNVLRAAEKWHQAIAGNKKFKKYDEQLYQESLAGTEPVMDLGDGMHIVRLKTPEALDFESDYMGHCVGKGPYDSHVKDGSVEIYSLRDENGEPHATFEVKNGKVQQCKGKNDKAPVAKYRPYVQEFVRAKKFGIEGDMQNIGLIKYRNAYYDLFNLPKDKKIVLNGDLDVSDMGLTELPDFSSLIVKGNFFCNNNKLRDLHGSPLQVLCDYDCSNNKLITLQGATRKVGSFHCFNNELTDLDGGPEDVECSFDCCNNNISRLTKTSMKVGQFYISGNPLKSLDNLPKIKRDLFAVNIAVEDMDNLPKNIQNEVIISNPDKNLFIIKQDKWFYNLMEQPERFIVKGDIVLSQLGLTELPDLSHIIVLGSYYCEGNKLKSFKGAPLMVGEDFWGSDNLVTDLEGMPQQVGGEVDLYNNPCLSSLKGISQNVNGNIRLRECPELKEIDALPQDLDGYIEFPTHIQDKYHLKPCASLVSVKQAVAAQKKSERNSMLER